MTADTTPSAASGEREALAPCPFCGAPASGYEIEPHSHAGTFDGFRMPDHPGSYVIEGECSCGSGLIGETQEEVTARWNRRAALTPAARQPLPEPDDSAESLAATIDRLADEPVSAAASSGASDEPWNVFTQPYCLHCEKAGHRTRECWSTHAIDDRSREIAALAQPSEAPKEPK